MSRLLLIAIFCVLTPRAIAQENLTESTAPRVIMETPYGGAVFVYKVNEKLVDLSGTPISIEKAKLHRISTDRQQEVGFVDLGVIGLKKINIRSGIVTLDGSNQGLPPGIQGTIYRIDRSTEYKKVIVARSNQVRQDSANYYNDQYPRQYTGRGMYGLAKRDGITETINRYKNLESRLDYYGRRIGGYYHRYGFPEGQANRNFQNSYKSENQHLWTIEISSIVDSYESLFSESANEDSKKPHKSDITPFLIP
ncbi:MAG TPA: hypothetical protein PKA63_10585 [Oligoflexia bacterium]|nr:hypothetical protein [Oligoflexia bacterium]HMP49104.1 hypothetical protein [Oligoflexia bacterium]